MQTRHKIELTREQYISLTELATLGEWVVNSRKEEAFVDQKYIDLLEHLYSYSKEFRTEDLIELDPSDSHHKPTHRFDEEVLFPLMDEYDDITFWDELELRLTERDIADRVGYEKYRAMPDDERMKVEDKYFTKYAQEFHENGLDNVVVKGLVI